MTRSAAGVIQELLDEMESLVADYHPDVGRTGQNAADLIQGTAFFPGGAGVWRGDRNGGPLPEHFPEGSVMLVGHNFDSKRSHDEALTKCGEVEGFFWRDVLLPILAAAQIPPEECFFTNVLMGLQPGSALGPMPVAGDYEVQCLAFFKRQLEIVRPRIVVALGDDSFDRIKRVVPGVRKVYHPSWREFRWQRTRAQRIAETGEQLRAYARART